MQYEIPRTGMGMFPEAGTPPKPLTHTQTPDVNDSNVVNQVPNINAKI